MNAVNDGIFTCPQGNNYFDTGFLISKIYSRYGTLHLITDFAYNLVLLSSRPKVSTDFNNFQ